jgi:tRNA1Val (adenine37-N6)-methyltransferase
MDQRATTLDVVSHHLELLQHQRGYRFGLDALLLATDLPRLPDEPHLIELGAAHGAVTLSVATRIEALRATAVERQPELFALLQENTRRNQLLDRVLPLLGDLRAPKAIGLLPHSADLVLANPPYYRQGQGRLSQDPLRAAAHHELHGSLEDFCRCAAYLLKPGGWFKLVIPPTRLTDLLLICESLPDLKPQRLRLAYPSLVQPAYLCECWLRRGKQPELQIQPPLILHDPRGDYLPEVAARILGAARPATEPDHG